MTSKSASIELSTEAVIASLRAGDSDRQVIRQALFLRDEAQDELFTLARERRDEAFPTRQAEVRSVIELSNICRQMCKYCSMARDSGIKRYVIDKEAVLAMAEFLHGVGRRVILLQSGENPAPKFVEFVRECVEAIKSKHPEFEIILCLGNLSRVQYQRLRDAGADRYVLKFEASNPVLYHALKESDTLDKRLECLHLLQELGFKVGSGNMVGLPGQTIEDIVDDLLLIGQEKLAMMSCTVFIPGEACDFRNEPAGDVEVALNFMALMRILYPDRLMPTTSALETVKAGGILRGLEAGANTITIHDGTPAKLADLFPIYSKKRITPNRDFVKELLTKTNLSMAPGPLL